jgi:hypothetical protein
MHIRLKAQKKQRCSSADMARYAADVNRNNMADTDSVSAQQVQQFVVIKHNKFSNR